MPAIIHPLLTLVASLTRQELARQVTYLKAENQILRIKLPKRIELSNQERRRLVSPLYVDELLRIIRRAVHQYPDVKFGAFH